MGTAYAEMENVLAAQQNRIAIVYAANDNMAFGVIQALETHHLGGKVLVTGQDATLFGLRNILLPIRP